MEIQALFRVFKDFFKETIKMELTPRILRVPLLPSNEKKWQTAMIAYYAKCICMGMRPVQEYHMVKNYLVEWQLREFLIGKQIPVPSQRNITFDWDNVETEGCQDMEIGNERVWKWNLFKYEL